MAGISEGSEVTVPAVLGASQPQSTNLTLDPFAFDKEESAMNKCCSKKAAAAFAFEQNIEGVSQLKEAPETEEQNLSSGLRGNGNLNTCPETSSSTCIKSGTEEAGAIRTSDTHSATPSNMEEGESSVFFKQSKINEAETPATVRPIYKHTSLLESKRNAADAFAAAHEESMGAPNNGDQLRQAAGHDTRPREFGRRVYVKGDGWGGGDGVFEGVISEADQYTFTLLTSSASESGRIHERHVLRTQCSIHRAT
jgi:hypothetical protein